MVNKPDMFPVFLDLMMSLLMCVLSRFSRVQLCHSIDRSLPGSPVSGVLQARILEWVALPSSKESS